MNTNAMDAYWSAVSRQLEQIRASQWTELERIAEVVAQALASDHFIYAFGTGHSHMLAEEIFYRAGGLARAAPILEEPLMIHEGAAASSELERKEGYAAQILERYPVARGDVLFVISNSGRNAVPIEMAMLARERGLRVVAITSRQQSTAFPSRHSSGKLLCDVAEFVLDNAAVAGDACISVPGLQASIGPTSTITSALLMNLALVEGIARAAASGHPPEVYASANTTGATSNAIILQKYRGRIRHL